MGIVVVASTQHSGLLTSCPRHILVDIAGQTVYKRCKTFVARPCSALAAYDIYLMGPEFLEDISDNMPEDVPHTSYFGTVMASWAQT